jgi:uncharacterized protein (TIGR02466 family)
MSNIEIQETLDIQAVPITIYKKENFVTLEDRETIKNIGSWQDRSAENLCDLTISYNILEDLGLFNLLYTFDQCVEKYVREVLGLNLRIKSVGSWVSRTATGRRHQPHLHRNTLITAVTYFNDTNEDLSQIVIHNKQLDTVFPHFKGLDLEDKIVSFNNYNNATLNIRPIQNQVIIMPGHVGHSTLPSVSEADRYCIGVNYFINDSLGAVSKKNSLTVKC